MNILDFCREYDIEFREFGSHHHCTKGFIQFDCPHCSPGTGRFRLGWNLKGQYFSCWHCAKLPKLNTWLEISKQPRSVIQKVLEDVDLDTWDVTRRELPGKLVDPGGLGPLKPTHVEYLKSRGFDPNKILALWNIKGIDYTNPEMAWRIYIPIQADYETISWTTRATSENNPHRYITARPDQERVNSKQVLYGEDYCHNTIIIVEGPTDVWAIGPGAAAIMGLAYTQAQLMQMSKYPNRFICFDNEVSAQALADKLSNDLMMFPGTTKKITIDSHDPGCATKAELNKLRGLLK